MVNYPTSLDTDGTLWLVADNIDDVEAKHHNALKDAVIALETALGITGAFNFVTDAEMTTHEGNPTDLHHLTDAQLGALHAVVVAGDLNHNDLANLNAGDSYEHITQTQKNALHAIVVAGDLNHNDLANINAGDTYEHISATQLAALHTKYALLDDLIANEIAVIKAIDDASINNTKWDYIAALSESPQTHMSASNPHSGSAGSGDLHSEGHVLATSGPHTGTLPLADLVVGSSGSLIRRGASDWEELVKADDSDVLTLVSGLPAWQAAGAPGSHSLDSGSHSDIATITETKGMILWWNGTGWAGLTDPAIVGLPIVCINVDGTIAWGGSTDMNLNAQILIGCGLPNIAGASIQTKKGDGLTTWTWVNNTEVKIEYVKCGTHTKAHKTGSVEMEFEAQESAAGHVYFEYSINDGSSWIAIDDMEQTWDQYETWAPTCSATLESTALGDNIWYRFRVTGDLVFQSTSEFVVLTHATTWAEFEMVE